MTYENLILAGIDIDSLLKRLMGNEALVKIFIQKFTEDKTFSSLQAAFENKDIKEAEMASHTLKGMCGNLSLSELYDLFTKQVSYIREGSFQRAEDMMPAICQCFTRAISGMKAFLASL